jgi:tetratricopeptide (TPR) repeat protein
LSAEKVDASILLKIAICQEKTNAISAAILSYEQYVVLCPTAKNEFLSLAELYNKTSKHDQAISTYKTYLKKYKDEKLSIKVAQYEYQRNNFVEAVKYFSEANVSKDPEQLFMFGNSMYMTKQYDDAVSILSICEKFNNFSKISEVYKLIAISYEQLKNTEKAIQYYKTYSQWSPKDSTICFHTAELQEQLHVSLAKDIYEANIKKFPNDSRNHLRLAEIYYKFNDFKKAKLSYEKVRTLNDTVSVDFLLKLARCYQETNDRDNEIKTYKNVLMKDNQNFTANKFLGIYCYEAGELKEGLAYLELAKSQNYSDPDMLYILGRIYLKDEFSNEGILSLQSAKKQKPNDSKIRLFIIESYKKYGKLREACLEIEELLKIERSFKNLDIYCKTLFELKNYQAAENIGIEMRKQEPSNIDLLMFLGKIKIEQAQLDDALEYFKMVSYVSSKYAPAICKRADIYLMKKDVDLAKEYYLKAIKADPKYAMSYYGIAMIYKYSGDTKQYMDNISKAVAIDSTNSVISEEIKRSKQN